MATFIRIINLISLFIGFVWIWNSKDVFEPLITTLLIAASLLGSFFSTENSQGVGSNFNNPTFKYLLPGISIILFLFILFQVSNAKIIGINGNNNDNNNIQINK